MEPLQAAVLIITDPLQTQEEPFRERVLQLQEAVVHRTDRFIPGPAPQHHKAGQPIPVPPVVQQDPQDPQLTAGPVHPDHHPTAGPVHQDHHLIADRAAVVHIPAAAAGQADRQVPLIPVAAGRQVVVHHTQAAVPGQAVQAAVRVQVAQEDNKLLPRDYPGQ